MALAALVGGCGAASPQIGGVDLSGEARERRLERVAGDFARGLRGPLVFCVVDSDAVSANAWPDGRVVVTRGLMDRLDDSELVAAVAHELGHLLGDGHLKSVVSLSGGEAGVDAEVAADAMGVRLLESRGLSGRAMGSMLRKVRGTAGLSAECVEGLERRMGVLAWRGR